MHKKKALIIGKALIPAAGAVLLLQAAAGVISAQTGRSVLDRLGVDEASARTNSLETLAGGFIYDSAAFPAFKALAPSARAEVVRAGLAWAKAYTRSGEFRSAYKELRESRKPEAPSAVPAADDSLARMKAELKEGIENAKKAQAGADAEMKKTMDEVIKELRAQLEEIEKNPEFGENVRTGAEMERAMNAERHQAALKNWNEDLPEDPDALIAKRLRQFLEASAGVDYAAALVPRRDKMVFAKDEYERKSAYWKLCFRAGREATEAARTFARAWLAELEKS